MKLDALDHPKTFDLAARLGVELPTVIGYLELLWAFTGKQASQGNVGKWPSGAIARACMWMGDPDKFISALVDAGFLDRDPTHKLVVHDWEEHAPGWVRAKLKKLSLEFISALEPSLEPSLEDSLEHSCEGLQEASTKGSEVKGSEASVKALAGKPPKKRKTQISSDFFPDETGVEKVEQANLSLAIELNRFRDYHTAKGSVMADWQAAWRTWVGNAVKFRGQSNATNANSRESVIAAFTGSAGRQPGVFNGTAERVA